MQLSEIAQKIHEQEIYVTLIYAFNSTGKTRLSVEYKDITKNSESGKHAGVYYNAFSEDLFVWDNDLANGEKNIKLSVLNSSLNKFHSLLTEDAIRDKLAPYQPKYDFKFSIENTEHGIDFIYFFIQGDEETLIKISRGEERIFVWCFFLALFEVEGWADLQNAHFFIDDPVSSLDDHNIFITATHIFNLIESEFGKNRRFFLTTHHTGLFFLLVDWLTKGEKSQRYKNNTAVSQLAIENNELSLLPTKKQIFLYHLHILQTLSLVVEGELFTFHFALLRQLLENISSFLGVGYFSYVLAQIGFADHNEIAREITALSHKKVYYFHSELMNEYEKDLFKKIYFALIAKYQFKF